MKKRKIKNKFIRRILRKIALWDNCPPEYKINFKERLIDLAVIIAGAFGVMFAFFYMAIYFC